MRALWSALSSVRRIINEISEFSGHYSGMSSTAKAKDTHTQNKQSIVVSRQKGEEERNKEK